MRKYACSLVLFFLLSCNHKNEVALPLEAANVIDISTAVDNSFDELIEEMDCIPLQTGEGGLDNCWKLIAYKGYYYFYSLFDFAVSIYDWNGTFVKMIDSRGKGKIMLPTDILVNKEKDELWICDSRSVVQKYTLSGDFLESSSVSLPNVKMEFINNDELLLYPDLFDANSKRLFYLLEADTYAVKDSFINNDKRKRLSSRISPSLFAKDDTCVYALLEKKNLICKYDTYNKELKPYITLDFNGKYFTEDMYPENGFTDEEMSKIIEKNEYIRGMVGFWKIHSNCPP